MVIGKLKYLIGPASGTISHPPGRSRVYILSRRTGVEWSDSVVGEGAPDPRTGKKGKSSVGGSEVDPHACALGSPGQVKIRFGIIRLSRHETA